MHHPFPWRSIPAVLALGLLASAVSCEDSDLTAPSDGTIVLFANPSTIVIDGNRLVEDPPGSGILVPETTGSTTLIAQVFDAGGRPLSNISVVFSTTAGVLASGGQGGEQASTVKTDNSGIAQTTLTISDTDPTDVVVRATSSAVSTEITVRKFLVEGNQPPIAVIILAPRQFQAVNEPVIFDGTASLDPDDDLITMYRWTITSTNPDPGRANPYVVEGPTASALDEIFVNVQSLVVTLQVTDNPDAPRLQQQGLPIPYSPNLDTLPYRIERCADHTAPTAVIAGNEPIQVFLAPGQSTNQILDGSASSDPEFGLDLSDYRWNCGGTFPPAGQGQKAVTCRYDYQSVAVDYVATLIVVDKGSTGQIEPSIGDYCNAKASEQATRTIRVSPRQ